MKKQYNTPKVNVISVECNSMIALSSNINISDKREDDVVMGESKSFDGGDWANIWK